MAQRSASYFYELLHIQMSKEWSFTFLEFYHAAVIWIGPPVRVCVCVLADLRLSFWLFRKVRLIIL